MTFTIDDHTKGAQKKAQPNTEMALTMPSEYQGNAITKRTPKIPTQGTKTGSVGSKNALVDTEESAKEASKYRLHPSTG